MSNTKDHFFPFDMEGVTPPSPSDDFLQNLDNILYSDPSSDTLSALRGDWTNDLLSNPPSALSGDLSNHHLLGSPLSHRLRDPMQVHASHTADAAIDSDSDAKVAPFVVLPADQDVVSDPATNHYSSSLDEAFLFYEDDVQGTCANSTPIKIKRIEQIKESEAKAEKDVFVSKPPPSPIKPKIKEGKVDWSTCNFLTRFREEACVLNQSFMNEHGPNENFMNKVCELLA